MGESLSLSEIIVDVTEAEEKKRKRASTSAEVFIIPVGDVLMGRVYTDGTSYSTEQKESFEECAVTHLWWCHRDRMEDLKILCKDWEDNGFTLHFGNKGDGTHNTPGVIEEIEQQRGKNECFCASTRGVGAYVGDRLAYFTLRDVERAYDFLCKRSDIPVAVLCDLRSYGVHERYKQAFDLANKYFQYYYLNGKPLELHKRKKRIESYDDV